MCADDVRADKVDIDVSLVHRLVATQFPQWADFRSSQLISTGGTTGPFVSASTCRCDCRAALGTRSKWKRNRNGCRGSHRRRSAR